MRVGPWTIPWKTDVTGDSPIEGKITSKGRV